MSREGEAAEVLAAVGAEFAEAEVFLKRGRSRRFEWAVEGWRAVLAEERGWALRAGDDRGSLFVAGSGDPPLRGPWPLPSPPPIRLPSPSTPAPWEEPPDLDAPLAVEGEAQALLRGIDAQLAAEMPGSRLLRALLEDGSSEAELASTRGVTSRTRQRAAVLRLEALSPGGDVKAILGAVGREARAFRPRALARRLADQLLVASRGQQPTRERGEVLLAPPVARKLLAALLPALVGPGARQLARALGDRRGRVGSARLTVVDDGRLSDGLLAAAADGEGVPTGRAELIGEGLYRGPLLAWWQEEAGEGIVSGCSRRLSWRDLPRPGPTHLHLAPDPSTPVASLLQGMSRGVYLLDCPGAAEVDFAAGRFHLRASGFAILGGEAAAPLREARLHGTLSALLHGIQAVARDLEFAPLDGMIGAPTVLVTGLDVD